MDEIVINITEIIEDVTINITEPVIDEVIIVVSEALQGEPGISAYELSGFEGTEEEWIASLQGADGHTPVKGVDYFDGITQDVSGKVDKVEGSSLVTTEEKSAWDRKQDALGFAPEDSANKVSAFQATPDDVHYPTEKLVKDSLDEKLSVEIIDPVIDQIIKFNGIDWINGNPNPVSAGAGVDFFQVPVPSGIEDYFLFSKIPADIEEMTMPIVVNNNKVLIGGVINPITVDVTIIDAGIWIFHTWTRVDIPGHTQLVNDVYKRSSAGAETLLFSAVSEDLGLELAQYNVSSIQQSFTLLATDRLVIKLSVQTTNIVDTTVYYTDGGTLHYAYISTPLITRHNELSGIYGSPEGYHLSEDKYNVVQNTIGVNHGDQDLSGKADINLAIAMAIAL
jgi:hypothetical protein